MQVFKAFFKITKLQFSSMLIYFGVFLILALLLSSSGSSAVDSSFKQDSLDIAVIDRDHSDASTALTNYLDGIHNLVPLEDDEETITDELYYRTVYYVLYIPEGYEESLQAGKTDDILFNRQIPNSYQGTYIDNQINEYFVCLRSYLQADYTLTDALKNAQESSSLTTKVVLSDSRTSSSFSKGYYFFIYLPYIFLSILIVGLAPILGSFNEKEVKNRMACSCLNQFQKNLQLILASLVFTAGIWCAFMLLGSVLMPVSMAGKYTWMNLVNSFVFLLVALSTTYLISLLTTSSSVLNMLANVIGLSNSFFCGVFVPQSLLGDDILSFARFLPTYWYVRAADTIDTFDGSLAQKNLIFSSFGIQLAFAVTILSISLVVAKMRKNK